MTLIMIVKLPSSCQERLHFRNHSDVLSGFRLSRMLDTHWLHAAHAFAFGTKTKLHDSFAVWQPEADAGSAYSYRKEALLLRPTTSINRSSQAASSWSQCGLNMKEKRCNRNSKRFAEWRVDLRVLWSAPLWWGNQIIIQQPTHRAAVYSSVWINDRCLVESYHRKRQISMLFPHFRRKKHRYLIRKRWEG